MARMRTFTRMAQVIVLFAVVLCRSICSAADLKHEEAWRTIAPFFRPPPELADNFGAYKSPLTFYDGRSVKSPADWLERRREILAKWHQIMGRGRP